MISFAKEISVNPSKYCLIYNGTRCIKSFVLLQQTLHNNIRVLTIREQKVEYSLIQGCKYYRDNIAVFNSDVGTPFFSKVHRKRKRGGILAI